MCAPRRSALPCQMMVLSLFLSLSLSSLSLSLSLSLSFSLVSFLCLAFLCTSDSGGDVAGPLYSASPWYDDDASFSMADLRVYNRVLTQREINKVVAQRNGVGA